MAPFQCLPESITAKKTWPYYERYHGQKDEENRRTGYGENHWSNAESLESYEGPFFRDTMHGWGTYRWRWLGEDGDHIAYEGHFFTNKMHGYGTMSYPDGRTFLGLFCNDLRWGPGIMRNSLRRADVGLWRGNQLIRLAWRPPTVTIVPDIAGTLIGPHFLEQFRTILANYEKTVGETNSALDLLKQQGIPPLEAKQQWKNVYSKYCTDMESVLCHKSEFYKAYYGESVNTLEETMPGQLQTDDKDFLYAWNNDAVILHMMKHAFQHEKQRPTAMLDLTMVLSGPRQKYPCPGTHELDCRTTLMACYMGDKSAVFSMIQEHNVHPNISDIQGNTAIMYATCGNRTEIVHYLVEAGAPIDTFNDACMTPLGVALIIYALTKYDVPLAEYANVLVTSSSFVMDRPRIAATDWRITRTLPDILATTTSQPQAKGKDTLGMQSASMRKIKSQGSMRAISSMLAKKRLQNRKAPDQGTFASATDLFSDEGVLYRNILHEYEMRIDTITHPISSPRYPKYLFDVRNMMDDVNNLIKKEDQHASRTNSVSAKGPLKGQSKNKFGKPTKSGQKIKDVKESGKKIKDGKEHKEVGELAWQQSEKGDKADSDDHKRIDSLNKIKLTIIQLLLEGANPRLVRCPQPALVTAIISGSAEIVQLLVSNGADVNEKYPQLLGYTPLHLAVSRRFSQEALAVTKVLLESGANTNERIQEPPTSGSSSETPREGPTLIHALIGRTTSSEAEEEFRKQTIVLLLEHGCDAYAFYDNRSAMDYVMELSLELLDVFIGSDSVALKGCTNSSNQSMLAKLLSATCSLQINATKRLQTVTNLLIFGADPLIPVKNEDKKYANIFVYAQDQLAELKIHQQQHERKTSDRRGRRPGSKTSGSKRHTHSKSLVSRGSNNSTEVDVVEAYEQAMATVAETARQLHIRWIQAKLLKELVGIIESKRIERPWHLIMREHKNEMRATLWLTAPRCLEIWHILKQAGSRQVKPGVLRQLLAIVHYYNERRTLSPKLIYSEKQAIDHYVQDLISQPKIACPGRMPWNRRFTTPELTSKAKKFNVCFECSLPLSHDRIECEVCNLVSFCDWTCMGKNARRPYCHPCSPQLIEKYFLRDPVRAEDAELDVIHESREEEA